MTSPSAVVPEKDAQLAWQTRDKNRANVQQSQNVQDTIYAPAANLGYDAYYQRLNTIRADSASATAGSIAGDQTRKAYEAAVAAKRLQEQQAAALADARARMGAIASGANFGKPDFVKYPGTGYPAGVSGWDGKYDGSDQAIANLMRAVGFPEDAIGVGLGVVQAESSGRLNATHPNTTGRYAGTIDQGLWQINDMHSSMYAGEDIFDPLVNTRIAFELWKQAGNSWSPWTTYNQGLANAHAVPPIQPANIPPYVANTGSSTGLRNALVSGAMQYIGVPYVWGGESMSGVDCSGLVFAVYHQLGIDTPRVSQDQAEWGSNGINGVKTSMGNLQPGDLVAWYGGEERGQYIGHIAVYAGNGEIIEAPDFGVPTRRRALRGEENGFGVHLYLPGD